jgi:putative redox protein
MLSVKMNWTGGLKFEGTSVWGHKIVTDGGKPAGGEEAGYKPTELLFYALAGCTGIDIVRILEKQRQELKSLEIEVVAFHGEEYPRPFHTVEMKFIATGKVDPAKLEKAIELSEQKYCVVGQTISGGGAKINTTYEIKND